MRLSLRPLPQFCYYPFLILFCVIFIPYSAGSLEHLFPTDHLTVIVAPPVEEAAKWIGIILLMSLIPKLFNKHHNGLYYGLVVGLSVAFFETWPAIVTLDLDRLVSRIPGDALHIMTACVSGIAIDKWLKGEAYWILLYPIAVLYHAAHNASITVQGTTTPLTWILPVVAIVLFLPLISVVRRDLFVKMKFRRRAELDR